MESEAPSKPAEEDFNGVSRVWFGIPIFPYLKKCSLKMFQTVLIICLKAWQGHFLQHSSQAILHICSKKASRFPNVRRHVVSTVESKPHMSVYQQFV